MNYQTGTAGPVRRRAIEHVSPEQILDEICKLFPEADDSSAQYLKDRIAATINELEDKNRLISKTIKGDFNNSLELKNYLIDNKFILTPQREKEFYKKLHQYILSKVSLFECIDYILNTFPVWTNLKKLLLEDRPGTNKKQWQYIKDNIEIGTHLPEKMNHRPPSNKVVENAYIAINNMTGISNYKQLSDQDTKYLISYLVDITIPNAQFENTIEQNGNPKCWFPFGITGFPKQTNVQNSVLYKLAYSFGLSLDNMYKLCDGAINYTADPFDYEAVMLRFGLKNHISYRACNEKVKYIKEQITVPIESDDGKIKRGKKEPTHYPLDDAIEKLEKFFDTNIAPSNIQQTADQLADYLCIISTSDSLENKRKELAAELMNELIDKTNVKNIQIYYSSSFVSIDDILYEKNCKPIAEDYITIINRGRGKIKRLTEDNQIEALHLICDGINVKTTGLGNSAFSEEKIKKILDKSIEIKRSDILRICYLDTLIEYINEYITDDTINDYFENKSNRFLEACFFHPLHLSLPLDALMYLSLSIQDRRKPEVYQAFLERKLNP